MNNRPGDAAGNLDPAVSIIIPVCNQADFTRGCIESISENPPEKSFEIIVVDDGSSDSTPDLLREIAVVNPLFHSIRNETASGFAGACNRGARAARGKYILFLNNDTKVCPGWFTPLFSILETDPSVGMVAPKLIFPDNTIQHCGKVWEDPWEPHSQPHHICYRLPADHPEACENREYPMLTGACLLLRRNEFLSVGGFDEKYENGWEDDDLCYAYRAIGKKNIYCAQSTVIHYQGMTLREKTLLLEHRISSVPADREACEMLNRELQRVRERFDRNRSRFFGKWEKEIIRDVGSEPCVPDAGRRGAAIIIVTYNSAATIIPCLESALTSSGQDDEIVVVDNASRDDTVSIVDRYLANDNRLTLIRNNENRGFTAATNQGIRASSRPLVVLLNPDTVAPAGWIEGLAAHLHDPSVAAVGPISNYVAGLQKEELYRRGDIPARTTVEEAARIFRSWNPRRSVETKLLIGFCLMVRRDVLESAGLLDESLFLGNDDLELSWRLRQCGFRLLVAADTFIYHAGQMSFISEKSSVTDRLVQESTDRLYDKLERHYGQGRVPPPEELWGISWFRPGRGVNSSVHEDGAASENRVGHNAQTVSIVILTFNQLDHTRRCIESIERHTRIPYELVLVDNGSGDGTVEWLKEQSERHPEWKVILNHRNLGFSAGCNQGMRAARGNFFLLLNNDVIVTEAWLEGLLECLNASPMSGIVGPMTNNISGIQKLTSVPYTDLSEIDSFAAVFREQNRHRRIPHRRIVGFCMLFRRELVDTIGFLDENFGSGNFEDDDFCLRAEIAGYRNVIACDVFIHHVGSASFRGNNMNYAASMSDNGKLFREKWSRPVTDRNEAKKILTLKTLEKADLFHQRGEYENMVETILQEGIRSVPDESRFYYALAGYFLDQGRYRDAFDTLQELPVETRNEYGIVLAGKALAGLGLLDDAQRLAEDALQLNPCSAEAMHLLGLAAYSRGDLEMAGTFWRNAIDADPGYGEPYTCLGMAALQGGEPDKAFNLFERGFLLSPLASEQALRYHEAAADPGELDRAETLFMEMHRIYPQHRRIHFLLIDLLIRQGKTGQAMGEIESACVAFGIDDGMISAGLDLRKDLGPMTIPAEKKERKSSVSLCMIMKNEEKNLPRCLSSLKPIVDEIILVDTGSTDRSIELADLFGAKVFEAQWNGDFSVARNISLDHASGDWILVMDADEVVSPLDYERFRKITDDARQAKMAYMIETRNYSTKVVMENWRQNDGLYPFEEAGAGWIPSRKIRLFPNRPGIRFEGSIHELVQRTAETSGVPITSTPIPVHHYGYLDQERQKRKNDEYYLLGKKKLAEGGEKDFRALCELAIQAGGIGRYEEAVELWERVIAGNPEDPLAYFNLGFVLMQLGKLRESRTASGKAIELQPQHIDAVINYAICEICLDGAEKAVEMLRRNLDIRPDHFYSQLLLAISRICIGEKEAGIAELALIKANGIAIADFINDCARKLTRFEKTDYSMRVLDAAILSGNGNGETMNLMRSLSPEKSVA